MIGKLILGSPNPHSETHASPFWTLDLGFRREAG